MKPRIDLCTAEDLEDYIALCSRHTQIDPAAARTLALASLRYARDGVKADSPEREPLALLERDWYASVSAGQPDYSVYADTRFLSDLWACWCVYSRSYLRIMRDAKTSNGNTVLEDIGEAACVVDLGCGTGYTTAAIAELFPRADVVGTNIKDTAQYSIASEVAASTGGSFRLVGDIAQVGRQADLVFASEYFEHHEDPVSHLNEVLDSVAPRCLVLANSFSASAIGHFPTYRDGTERVANKLTGRRFNTTLRKRGYEAVETGFWNGRPAYWRRK